MLTASAADDVINQQSVLTDATQIGQTQVLPTTYIYDPHGEVVTVRCG